MKVTKNSETKTPNKDSEKKCLRSRSRSNSNSATKSNVKQNGKTPIKSD